MQSYTVERILVGRLPGGTDLLAGVQELCQRQGVRAGHVSLIGALTRAQLGWYDEPARCYHPSEAEGPLEVLHCVGNISVLDGAPFVHLHATLSNGAGPVLGGHVLPGCQIFVAEYQLTVYREEPLTRQLDPATGLKLWPADEPGGQPA